MANELAKKYGPVLGLKIGIDKSVVVCGLSAIREFLLSDDLDGRPMGLFFEMRTFGLRQGLIMTDQSFWHEQRRFIVRHLREFGFGRRNMSAMIEDEAQLMVEHFKENIVEKNGYGIVQMDKVGGIHILNTLWTMLAGVRYSPEDKEVNRLQSHLNELFKNADMVGALFSQFPILRFIAPNFSGYNLYMDSHKPLWKFITEEVEHHKKTFVPNQPRDLIDVYLQMLNEKDKPKTFSKDQLLCVCIDLFMAGSETTTKSFGFGFTYLLLNPEVQKKAQAEIDAVVGRERLPTLHDRPNMPYMEGIVYESIRMFIGRGLGIPHRALKDTTLCGYTIPKDTMVIPNFYGILQGNEFGWDDPEKFRPERFIENGKIIPLPDNFIPFGLGKRRCMGETLAKANLFLFISALLQNFTFSIPVGCDPPSLDGNPGITPGPKPFKAQFQLRN
ncbi:Cytochrome P450 [Popillia japonica]|uniref:Cytochrome P450 n=1 Tax=Popillia japonica TaxID=7064 RepID=A0AAW1K1V3_POPJA